MASAAPRPEVFISYSHRDEGVKDFVDRHLGVLEIAGNVDVWDDREIAIGDDWYQKIEAKLNSSAVAVLLISTDFLRSEFCMKEEVSRLLERRKRDGMMIAPILLRPCAWTMFPWLAALQMLPRDNTALLELDELQQERVLTEVVTTIHGFLQEQAKLIAAAVEKAIATGQRSEVKGDNNTVVQVDGDKVQVNVIAGPKANTKYPALEDDRIDLTRLPTSGFDVVGRDDELRMLDEAFDGNELNVVALRAWGGVGKSTLVNKWCEYLTADNFRGAKRVFAWSFYSQGTNQRVTSADAFIDEALRFFGDDDPSAGSPWAKGERLAELVGKEKALLILDGMEPLQDEHQGIKDPALARLVECLAVENAGLCVITTREPVKEFEDFPETTVENNLEQLSKEAGRALLRIKGLRASDDLLEQVSEAFGHHALALNLLASFLKLARRPIEDALTIPDLPDVSVDAGKHPRRVMEAFAQVFSEGPELDLLHVMGLFDRPASGDCIDALRQPPAILGLTDHLVREKGDKLEAWWRRAFGQDGAPSSDAIWDKLLAHLRSLGLLAEASHHAPNELDAHPLVREQFGARLRHQHANAWKAGHERLYEHLIMVPEQHQPDTLAEMAPLFQAIHHGCRADLHEHAIKHVYVARIRRGDDAYQVRSLGAFSTNLGVMSLFFTTPWSEIVDGLDTSMKIDLLLWAGFDLRNLGKTKEAIRPFEVALRLSGESQSHSRTTWGAENLSVLCMTIGEIKTSLEVARTAVHYAEESGHPHERVARRTLLADVLHCLGCKNEALEVFIEAEELQSVTNPKFPRLYSLWGYRYCDLLLFLNRAEEVRQRGTEGLNQEFGQEHSGLLNTALMHLLVGRASQILGDLAEAECQLGKAIKELRAAGQLDGLHRSLLARAAFLRDVEEFDKSRKDLDEVMRIATRSGMRLFECDAHLEYARLILAEGGSQVDARVSLGKAEALVRETGYHRRDGEVADLKERLGL